MRVQEKGFKLNLRKAAVILAFFGVALFFLYAIIFRNDWMFGITDRFFNERDSLEIKIVDYSKDDLESISLEELLSDKNGIKTTNSLSLINNKGFYRNIFIIMKPLLKCL